MKRGNINKLVTILTSEPFLYVQNVIFTFMPFLHLKIDIFCSNNLFFLELGVNSTMYSNNNCINCC